MKRALECLSIAACIFMLMHSSVFAGLKKKEVKKKPDECELALTQATKEYTLTEMEKQTEDSQFIENPFSFVWRKISSLWGSDKNKNLVAPEMDLKDKMIVMADLNKVIEPRPKKVKNETASSVSNKSKYTLTFSNSKSFVDQNHEEIYKMANMDLSSLDWKSKLHSPNFAVNAGLKPGEIGKFTEIQAKSIQSKRLLLAKKSEEFEDLVGHDSNTLTQFLNAAQGIGLPVFSLEEIREQLFSQYRTQNTLLPHILEELIFILDHAIQNGDKQFGKEMMQDAKSLKAEVEILRKRLLDADRGTTAEKIGQLLLRNFGNSLVGKALVEKYATQKQEGLVWDFKRLEMDLSSSNLNPSLKKLLILSQSSVMDKILLSKIFTQSTIRRSQVGEQTQMSDADPALRPARNLDEADNFYRDGVPLEYDFMRLVSGDLMAHEYREVRGFDEAVYDMPKIVTAIMADNSGSMENDPNSATEKTSIRDALILNMIARSYAEVQEGIAEHILKISLFNMEILKKAVMNKLPEFEKEFTNVFENGYLNTGGTNITLALVSAFEKIAEEEKKNGVAQFANIIFITDGEDSEINLRAVRNARSKISEKTSVALHCINLGVINPALQQLVREFGGDQTQSFSNINSSQMKKLATTQPEEPMIDDLDLSGEVSPSPKVHGVASKITNLVLTKQDLQQITSFKMVISKIANFAKNEVTIDYQNVVSSHEILSIQDRLAAFLNKLRFTQTESHQALGRMRLALFVTPEQKPTPLNATPFLQDYSRQMVSSLDASLKVVAVQALLPHERAELLEKGIEEIANVIGVSANEIMNSIPNEQKNTFYRFLQEKK